MTVDDHTEFTLILSNAGDVEDLAEDLFAAGRDDAFVAQVEGAAMVTFDGHGELIDAILEAIRIVRDLRPEAVVVAVDDPGDLVTMSDAAKVLGRTRQSVHQLATGARGSGFPTPTLRAGESTKLWSLVDIATWAGDENLLRRAAAIELVNLQLRLGRNPLRESDDRPIGRISTVQFVS